MSPKQRAGALLPLGLLMSCSAVNRVLPIKINTSNVRVYEGETCLSKGGPPRLVLDPRRDHELRFEADGYEPQRLLVESTVSGLNVFLVVIQTLTIPIIALPFFWHTWAATGYWYEFEPTEPEVRLVPIGGSSSTPPQPPSRPTPSAPVAIVPSQPRPVPPPQPRPAPPPPKSTSSSPPAVAPKPQPPRPQARPAFCGTCGARVPSNTTFCGGCGRRVDGSK